MVPDLPCGPDELRALFGHIDIYLFDQLLRGRITPRMRVLDAGCGEGRNAHYLMRCGAEVFGVDADPDQVERTRALASEHAPRLPADNFRVARLSALPFPDACFDAVICSAVLHFAESESELEDGVREMWRVLGPGGVLFVRLATTIGLEREVVQLRERWYRLPDGTERLLVDEPYLLALSADLRGELLDPLKTTNVQNQRAMTTWVLAKGPQGKGTPGRVR
jgi:tellurite methyltransferase